MDLPHQQRLRDVMGLEIGDGAAGIMKLIVARRERRTGRCAIGQTLSGDLRVSTREVGVTRRRRMG
jgi:hypothetical protein